MTAFAEEKITEKEITEEDKKAFDRILADIDRLDDEEDHDGPFGGAFRDEEDYCRWRFGDYTTW